MNDLVDIELPFGGFYQSTHDTEIDRAIEDGFNYNYETDEDIELDWEFTDSVYSADVDWSAIRREYCEKFTEAFGDKFGLTLTFDELTSPREYNFATDRIFVKIPREQIDKIRGEVEANEGYPEYIRERFTSYSGFWSHYSSDYKDEQWTRDTLDECQYEVILRYWLDNISDEVGSEGWNMEEWYLTNDFEMLSWDSIIAAHESIEKYIKEKK